MLMVSTTQKVPTSTRKITYQTAYIGSSDDDRVREGVVLAGAKVVAHPT